jgi:hypothetical protein
MGQSQYNLYNEGASNPTAVDILTPADCNGDPDCNGLELVAGPVIYSVDLSIADGDPMEIKVQRDLRNMVPANSGYRDGYTAVADVDLDGILDIIVTSVRQTNQFGMYVWNKNGLIRWFPYPTNTFSSGSLACIANVYDDTKQGFAEDYPEILICSSLNFTCYNLQKAALTPAGRDLPCMISMAMVFRKLCTAMKATCGSYMAVRPLSRPEWMHSETGSRHPVFPSLQMNMQ